MTTASAPTLEERLARLEREALARAEQCIRLEIALDTALREIRRLAFQLRTGITPDQAMAALERGA